MVAKVGNFIREVKSELTKVSWSSRQELIGATAVVLAVTLMLALCIGAIDFGLARMLAFLIR